MKTVREVEAALNYLLSSEGKILDKMVSLVKSPVVVSENIKELREFIDSKSYNESVKKSYKGFISNIVKLHEMELLDIDNCKFNQLRTVRQLKESLTYSKKNKVKLSEAIIVKTSPKAPSSNKSNKGVKNTPKSLKDIIPSGEGEDKTLTIELVKKLNKEDRDALKKQIVEVLSATDEPLIITQVAQVLIDAKLMEL